MIGDTLMDSWVIPEVYDSTTDADGALEVNAIISACAAGPAVRVGAYELSPEQAYELFNVLTKALIQCCHVRPITGGAA